jgi:MoaA/NifB/PqqE/SkfB family radical SAM enzyme
MSKNAVHVYDKLKQKSILQLVREIDWSKSSDAPYIVEFDPTTKCNLACPDCISGALLNQDEFGPDRAVTLTQEMIDSGVKGVILIGGGEPMAHPKIGEIIEMLGKSDVAIGITTNGLYLKKHLDVTSAHTSWVRVSVDAASAEMFQSVRPSRTGDSLFYHVLEKIRIFSENKRPGQILGYSFMVYAKGDYGFKGVKLKNESSYEKVSRLKSIYTSNVSEIYQAAALAKDIGCDYFEIKPMYDVNHFTVMQAQSIADAVEEQLDTKLRASLRGESNLEPKAYKRCAVAQLRTLVTPSGVYVCPYFRGVEHKKVGDVHTVSFHDMWHGEKRSEVMSKLDPSVDCPMHCIRHESNLFLEKMIAENFTIDPTGIVDDYDRFI